MTVSSLSFETGASRFVKSPLLQRSFDAIVIGAGCLLLLSALVELLRDQDNVSAEPFLLALNGILTIFGFSTALKKGSPLFLTTFYFDFIFFSIGPLQQIRIVEDSIYTNQEITTFSILLCLLFTSIALAFQFFYREKKSEHIIKNNFLSRSIFEYQFRPRLLFVFSFVTNIGLIALYANFLFSSRDTFDDALAEMFDKSTVILLIAFLNPFAFVSAAIGFFAAYKNKSMLWIYLFAICLALAFIVNNPTITARFRLSNLLCFGLLAFVGGWRNTRILVIFIVAGTYISAFLNEFRYETFFDTNQLGQSERFFDTMDYHILNLISYAVLYCEQYGYSYGSNIISAFFFFVPRSLWDEKSQYISYYTIDFIRSFRYYGTDNLSSPPILEGYFAFGITGAAAFSAAIMRGLVWIERTAQTAAVGSPAVFFACVAPMLNVIVMRGPFIVGYSESVCMLAAVCFAVLLLILYAPSKPKSDG